MVNNPWMGPAWQVMQTKPMDIPSWASSSTPTACQAYRGLSAGGQDTFHQAIQSGYAAGKPTKKPKFNKDVSGDAPEIMAQPSPLEMAKPFVWYSCVVRCKNSKGSSCRWKTFRQKTQPQQSSKVSHYTRRRCRQSATHKHHIPDSVDVVQTYDVLQKGVADAMATYEELLKPVAWMLTKKRKPEKTNNRSQWQSKWKPSPTQRFDPRFLGCPYHGNDTLAACWATN